MYNITFFLGEVINRFLGFGDKSFNKAPDYKNTMENETNEWIEMLKVIVGILDWALPVIMIGLGMVGAIYVIILSVRYAKSENE